MITGTLEWRQSPGQLALIDAQGQRVTLAVDAGTVAARCFSHQPPRPVELERAIDVIEDAIMAVAGAVRPPVVFVTADALMLDQPGIVDGRPLSLDEVEALFQRQASIALGAPLAPDEPRLSGAGVAALLLLRETMHHFGARSVTVAAQRR